MVSSRTRPSIASMPISPRSMRRSRSKAAFSIGLSKGSPAQSRCSRCHEPASCSRKACAASRTSGLLLFAMAFRLALLPAIRKRKRMMTRGKTVRNRNGQGELRE